MHVDGSFRIGDFTIFGWNAMHVAIRYSSKRFGHVCFHPPGRLLFYGKYCPWYFYLSTNGTPWNAYLAFGPGVSKEDKEKASIRRRMSFHLDEVYDYPTYGWRFKSEKNDKLEEEAAPRYKE